MKGIHPAALLAVYAAIGVAPLAWIAADGLADAGAWRAAAIATGVAGLAFLFLQVLSSGRYRLLSARAGMDRTMRFHQLAARAVLALAVLHPLLFLVPADPGGWRDVPARAAALFSAPHLASGTVAWVLLILLVAMGVLRRRLPLRYELWRASHALLAVAVAAAGLHHALAIGTHSASPALAAGWWLLAALALGTLGWLYLVKPFLLVRRAWRVAANREVGRGIREIALEPVRGRAMDYQAGQFAWVLLDQPPLTVLDHPFSFSSAPAEAPRLRLLVKARGDFTVGLGALPVGAPAYLDGPYGNFTLEGREGDAIALIAGGIGIAPVMSLLRQLRARRDPRPIALLYGARNASQLVHADEIRESAGALDLRWRFFVDEPGPGWAGGTGAITRAAVHDTLRAHPSSCLCFVCGPTEMMLACRDYLLAGSVPRRRIVLERFDYD